MKLLSKILVLFLVIILAFVVYVPVSAQTVEPPTPTFSPLFVTATPQPTRNVSCPVGTPQGWLTLTPNSEWSLNCSHCVRLPTSSPIPAVATSNAVLTQIAIGTGTPSTSTPFPTPSPTITQTPIPSGLTCGASVAGSTCINHGNFLEFQFDVTGSTTDSVYNVGMFRRAGSASGNIGILTDYTLNERSNYASNTIALFLRVIQSSTTLYNLNTVTATAGKDISTYYNQNDTRNVTASTTADILLQTRSNVDWPLTYSRAYGRIYVYSQPSLTFTPTPGALPTATPSPTPGYCGVVNGGAGNGSQFTDWTSYIPIPRQGPAQCVGVSSITIPLAGILGLSDINLPALQVCLVPTIFGVLQVPGVVALDMDIVAFALASSFFLMLIIWS